jgi:hypothetical protein
MPAVETVGGQCAPRAATLTRPADTPHRQETRRKRQATDLLVAARCGRPDDQIPVTQLEPVLVVAPPRAGWTSSSVSGRSGSAAQPTASPSFRDIKRSGRRAARMSTTWRPTEWSPKKQVLQRHRERDLASSGTPRRSRQFGWRTSPTASYGDAGDQPARVAARNACRARSAPPASARADQPLRAEQRERAGPARPSASALPRPPGGSAGPARPAPARAPRSGSRPPSAGRASTRSPAR